MKSGLEVVAHPTGPWLIKAGAVVYAVPPELGRPLRFWHGCRPSSAELAARKAPPGADAEQWAAFMASLAAALAGGSGALAQRLPPPVWLRLPLVPARWVQPAARRLAPLAGGRGLLGLGLVGLVGYTHLGLTAATSPTPVDPTTVGAALGLFVLTALWHELGHAAALASHGYPPGGIGAGLLFVIPVLYADVTAVGVLPRAGRMQVDSAGVVFQFGLGGILATVGGGLGLGPAPAVAAWLALLAICWSLFPFVRADGYWLVCDLLELTELEKDPEPPPGWAVAGFLKAYRLANAAFLLAMGFVLPWRYWSLLETVLARLGDRVTQPALRTTLLLVFGLGLGLVWWNLLRRVARLVRSAG